ncbi:hypothetical protein AB0C77_12845 [Streptomyces sp. NPDC048629]|uniref:hypothetical protein n=1 Tax=Streptomyces sp. NPDC048629 TaxID=3154824 RepID=UPI0034190967
MRHDPVPDDLVAAQHAYTRAYEQLARPHTPGDAGPTVLRRRLLRLGVRVHFHPYWATAPAGASRPELLLLVRAQQRSREEAAA